jgi:hypothetical protein
MPVLPSTWNSDGTLVHQALYSDPYVGYSSSSIGYSGGVVVDTATYTATPDIPSAWFVNTQGVIDTWDNANRTWDSAYTWDGTVSQTTNAVPSSWSEV